MRKRLIFKIYMTPYLKFATKTIYQADISGVARICAALGCTLKGHVEIMERMKYVGEMIGYIRVSDEEQNLARQEELMKQLGITIIFSEKRSGKNKTDRTELTKLLNYVRKGDTVVVESYSRLARSLRDLLYLVDELSSKGVNFKSYKENIDTSTPQGELMFIIFGGLAEFERKNMLQRQAEGIAIAKKAGKYKGRKPIELPNFGVIYGIWKEGKITGTAAAKMLGVDRSTFYRKIKEI